MRIPSLHNQILKSLFILIIASLFFLATAGCINEAGAVNLGEILDTGNLFGSSRDLGDALVEGAAEFAKTPGALAYFRFAYATGIANADQAVGPAKEHVLEKLCLTPEELAAAPMLGIRALDDAYALYGLHEINMDQQWTQLDEAYNGISNEAVLDINTRLAVEGDVERYALHPSGFFSEVDNNAYICGYVAHYRLNEPAGFEPASILMERFNEWWLEIPEDDGDEIDMLALMDEYDVVTYPYVLDFVYMLSGDLPLYAAMSEILTTYLEALAIDGLSESVALLENKGRSLEQLCVLSRLFRRMYAFTDEDEFLEMAEGILREIGPLCLAEGSDRVLPYSYALALVEEPALHVVVIGPSDEPAWTELVRISRDRHEPRLALMPLDSENDSGVIEEIGYLPASKPTCFLCIDTNCFQPLKEPEKLAALFDKAYDDIAKARAEKIKNTKEGD